MKYKVLIEETVSETFEVEAESEGEAVKLASDKYEKGEFVLEPGNLEAARVMLCNDANLQEWHDIV